MGLGFGVQGLRVFIGVQGSGVYAIAERREGDFVNSRSTFVAHEIMSHSKNSLPET